MADLLMKVPIPYEPKKKNRFILRFPSDLGINEWYVQSAARPKIDISSTPIKFLNTETYVAGSFKWNPISVKLLDPIGPSAAQAMMEWIRTIAESVTGRMGYAAGYKRNVDLEMLDPTGVVIEKWLLVNAFPTGADFGGVGYDGDGLVDITFSLQIDRAILVY